MKKRIFLFGVVWITFTLSAQENIWNKFRQKALQDAQEEEVSLDNLFVQSYNGYEGIWHSVSSWQEWSRLIQKFGTNENLFFRLNRMTKKSRGLWEGQYVFFPYSKKYIQSLNAKGIGRQKVRVPKSQFLWPVIGMHLTSRVQQRWGRLHPGLDIAAVEGTPVIAAQDGEVEIAGPQGAYGIAVFLKHNSEYQTRYGHLSRAFVRKGEKVKKGQVIALSGNTGRSTGPHLHFEVRCEGIILNPEFYLPEFTSSMHSAMEFETNLMYLEQTERLQLRPKN